jgi:hypothetical protein
VTEVTYTTWARLEPRVSDPSLAPGVQAAVEDPLWLLGRQWQLGELDGEDTGSPVAVDVYGSSVVVDRLLLGQGSGQNATRAIDLDVAAAPLEAIVAREPAPDPESLLAFRLDVAGRLARELAARGAPQSALAALAAAHPLDPAEVAKTAARCGPAEAARLELLGARLFDGTALLLQAEADFATATASLPAAATDAVRAVLDAVAEEVDLGRVRAATPGAAAPAAWDGAALGSSFALGAAAASGEVVLRAADWEGETLDWWAFDASGETALGAKAKPAPLTGAGGAPLSRLPSRLGFRGAPSIRYWEFEDGAVDLVATTAAAHETALMAVLQYAFVYGGDWSSVPIEVPVGSFVSVESVVVRDTFGMRTLVRPAGRRPGRPAAEQTRLWTSTGDTSGSVLVPPRLGTVLEGEPVEETLVLRDEAANLAWAVELLAPDAAGHPVSWDALAPPPTDPPASQPDLPPDRQPLRYRLASEVPDHWFPLVPEAAGDRLARFRVGVLPSRRAAPPAGPAVPPPPAAPPRLPRALLLRELAASGLREQEVPRDGRRLLRRPSYARWVGGTTHVWTARRVSTGRGEGASGLVFDTLEP